MIERVVEEEDDRDLVVVGVWVEDKEGGREGERVGVAEAAAAVILPNTKLAPDIPTT